jgi:hypothetical protein
MPKSFRELFSYREGYGRTTLAPPWMIRSLLVTVTGSTEWAAQIVHTTRKFARIRCGVCQIREEPPPLRCPAQKRRLLRGSGPRSPESLPVGSWSNAEFLAEFPFYAGIFAGRGSVARDRAHWLLRRGPILHGFSEARQPWPANIAPDAGGEDRRVVVWSTRVCAGLGAVAVCRTAVRGAQPGAVRAG